MTKRLLQAALLALAVLTAAGCKNKEASCEDVFQHIKSLTPEGMREMLDKTKDAAIAKCETMSAEQRQCALDAKTMEELQRCK